MDDLSANAVFTDPPFGCAIEGYVAGARPFVMASGEMSDDELLSFFMSFNSAMATHLKPGAVVYEVIDWRSLHLLMPQFGDRRRRDLLSVV